MTNQECIEHLQRLKMGINILKAFAWNEDKDLADIEAIDYAIKVLDENKKIRELFDETNDADDFYHEVRILVDGE